MAAFLALNGTGINEVAGSTLTFTTTRAIQIGEHVVVCDANTTGSAFSTAVTVGALTLTKEVATGTAKFLSLWSARATSLLASGTTVTVTWSVTPTSKWAACISLSDVTSGTYLDATQKKAFTVGTTAMDSGVSASTRANGVAVAAVHYSTNGTVTVASPYIERAKVSVPNNLEVLEVAVLDNVAAAAQQASWTLGTSSTGDCLVAVFFGDPPSVWIPSQGRRPVPMIQGPDTDAIMRMYRRG